MAKKIVESTVPEALNDGLAWLFKLALSLGCLWVFLLALSFGTLALVTMFE